MATSLKPVFNQNTGVAWTPVEPDKKKLGADSFVQLGVKFDPKTGSTTPDESNKISLVKLIQTYKDQCGMEFVQKQLRLGLLKPEDLADDGKHSGDGTLPIDVNDAYRAALNAGKEKQELAKALGIDLPENVTPDQIKAALEKIYAKVETAKPAEEVNGDE